VPFWLASTLSTGLYGFVSTKIKSIKIPLAVGFLLLTGGMVGLATINPNDSTSAIVFSGLAGCGFGAPLVLCVVGMQLSTPHSLIATATAVTVTTRSMAASVFTAIFAAALSDRLAKNVPSYVAEAALKAGLPPASLVGFVGAIATDDTAAIPTIPGVTPAIIGAALVALKQAFADGIRVVYIIASPFALLGVICCYFIGDLKKIMTYHVDAPVEELHAKRHVDGQA
jgi:hypothetical protein